MHKCQHCGADYAPKSARSRFCSGKCETYWWRANNKEKYAAYMRAWASKNPEKLAQYNEQRRKGWPTITCPQCSKAFQMKGGSSKFCSARCRARAYYKLPKVRDAHRKRWNKWLAANRDRVRATARNHYHRHALKKLSLQPWGSLLLGRSRDAKKKNIPFELTPEWAQARWTNRCELTGIEFAPPEKRVGYKNRNFSPSIDKIIPTLGYTTENSRFVLWAINSLKRDGTDAQMYQIAEALIARRQRIGLEGILALPG